MGIRFLYRLAMGKLLYIWNMHYISPFSYVTRIDFTPDELGEEYGKTVTEVLKTVFEGLNTDGDDLSDEGEQEPNTFDRLSPQLEKMKLKPNSISKAATSAKTTPSIKHRLPPPSDALKEYVNNPINLLLIYKLYFSVPGKKSKKKVAITTISSVPQ